MFHKYFATPLALRAYNFWAKQQNIYHEQWLFTLVLGPDLVVLTFYPFFKKVKWTKRIWWKFGWSMIRARIVIHEEINIWWIQRINLLLRYGKLGRDLWTLRSAKMSKKININSSFHLFIQFQWLKLLFSHWIRNKQMINWIYWSFCSFLLNLRFRNIGQVFHTVFFILECS